MDPKKADWCRLFAEHLLASGATDVESAARMAFGIYPSAQLLTPQETVQVLLVTDNGYGTFINPHGAKGGPPGKGQRK